MGNLREHVEKKLKRVGVVYDATELDDLFTDLGVADGGTGIEYNEDSKATAKQAILNGLLEVPKMDITEGDMSIKYNHDAIATYVAALRTELGIADPDAATVSNLSNIW